MNTQIAVALIGMFGGWIAGWLAAKTNWRAEIHKWRRSRDDLIATDLRNGLQQLTLKLASSVHSMCWLTWLASQGPDKLTQTRIDAYDKEMHELLPQIMGLHAVVASIRPDTYANLKDFIERIYDVDLAIGNASLLFSAGSLDSAHPLAACYKDATLLDEELPAVVRSIISDVAKVPESELEP